MITGKYISRIISAAMAAAVLGCFLAMLFSREFVDAFGGSALVMQYRSELFDTEQVMQINIIMEETEWEDMLVNASAEKYYSCDVVINGQRVNHAGIRPKGNTSLSAIVQDPDTDRYSLKLEFDHYVDGQTCLGLDKLILNNNYADATNMKEAVIYDMYQYLGADASLYNYAEISVNGEYWGVYLALEAVEDSFLLRNYGAGNGALYKPESMGGGGSFDGADFGFRNRERGGQGPGNGESEADGFFPGNGMPEMHNFPGEGIPGEDGSTPGGGMPGMGGGAPGEGIFETNGAASGENMPWQPENIPDNGGERGGFEPAGRGNAAEGRGPSMGGSGANLNYTDDDLESYSAIWEGEVKNTGKKDHRRVVNALKNISEGTELETYLDVDNVLKYMAVHTFSVNMDSLSGNMAHNYYLYEYNGKLNMIPWDYNLSFGGMSMGAAGSASEMVNYAIDTPFQGTDFFDALLENEEYLSRYHEYMRKLAEEYVLGGRFEEVYSGIRSRIDALVETDPTAFYSYEEYEAGAEMLYRTVLLRAESILGQLNGTIPSTDADQRSDASGLVDASGIDVSVMGVFNMGGKSFQFNGVEVRFSEDRDETGQGSAASDRPGNSQQEGEGTGSRKSTISDAIPVMNDDVPQDFRVAGAEASDTGVPGAGMSGTGVPGAEESDTGEPGSGEADTGEPGSGEPDTGVPGAGESATEVLGSGVPRFGMSGVPENKGDGGIDMTTRNSMTAQNKIIYAVCLVVSLAALLAVKCYQRVPGKYNSGGNGKTYK